MTAAARAAVRRLRSGVVPLWTIDKLSVGYANPRRRLNVAVDALLNGVDAEPVFVRGEWGTGKSHLLMFARGAAAARGVPSTSVDLNARSVALSHATRFYLPAVENITHDGQRGLQAVLIPHLNDSVARESIEEFALDGECADLDWPLLEVCRAHRKGELLGEYYQAAWRVLLGGDLSWADYSYKRVRALARIQALGGLFAALGMGGLAIVFDEAETIDQLANIRSRMSAYGVIGRLCQMKSIWCLFGITERFDFIVRNDLQRDKTSVTPAEQQAKWFLKRWEEEAFQVMRPPAIDLEHAATLASSVVALYVSAYGNASNEDRAARACVDEWTRNPGRNPRRLIRALIHRLDAQRPLATA